MLLMQAAEFKADRKMFNAKAKKWTLQHAEGGLGGGGLNAADNTVGGGSSSGSSAAASGGGGGGNGSVGGHADGNRKPPMGTASVQTVREFSDCFLQLKTFCFFYLHLRECIIIIILIKYASSFTELRFPVYLALICCASITACSGSLCHFIEIILLESILLLCVCLRKQCNEMERICSNVIPAPYIYPSLLSCLQATKVQANGNSRNRDALAKLN